MRITLKDIAAVSKVSTCSVSQVLNNKPRAAKLSEETRCKILAAAQKLGYYRDELAHSIATGKSNIISVIIPNCGYTLPILSGISNEAEKLGFSIKLITAPFEKLNWDKALRESSSYRVAGIISCGVCYEQVEKLINYRKKNNTPVVVSMADNSDMPLSNVATDQESGAEMAVEYLLSLGHRKIFCLWEDGYYYTLRKDIYCRTMEKNHLEPKIFTWNDFDKLIAANPEAVFCIHDGHAQNLLIELYRKRIFIPDAFSVIGFGDLEHTANTSPPLTTVHEPYYEMGINLLQCLQRQIKGETKIENIKLPVQLAIRETTSKNKKYNN